MDAEGAARAMIAHLFQRSGRVALSESELANAASLDLDWFPPKKARQVVAGLVRAGWLERDPEGDLRPVFDVRGVRVPLGFRPSESILGSLPPPGAIGDATGGGKGRTQETTAAKRKPIGGGEPAEPSGEPEPEEGGSDLDLGALLQGFAERSGEDVGVWVQRMERLVQGSGDVLRPEVALLLAAAEAGIDVSDLAGGLRRRLESASPG